MKDILLRFFRRKKIKTRYDVLKGSDVLLQVFGKRDVIQWYEFPKDSAFNLVIVLVFSSQKKSNTKNLQCFQKSKFLERFVKSEFKVWDVYIMPLSSKEEDELGKLIFEIIGSVYDVKSWSELEIRKWSN